MFENRVLYAGGVRCHVLIDGWRAVSPRFVFKGYDEAVHGPAVAPGLDAEGLLPGRFAALLIEAPDGLVLVDAGVGPFAGELEAGRLVGELDGLGISRTEVRAVVVTHGHADHVGGLVTNDGVPAFEEARHLVHPAELAFWRSSAARELPGDAGEPARVAFGALRAGGLLEEAAAGRVARAVDVVEAPGHTPGHLAVIVNDALLWAGDAIVHPVNVAHPEWVSVADMDASGNARTRAALLARAADGRHVLAGSHLPVEGWVRREHDGFIFEELPPRG